MCMRTGAMLPFLVTLKNFYVCTVILWELHALFSEGVYKPWALLSSHLGKCTSLDAFANAHPDARVKHTSLVALANARMILDHCKHHLMTFFLLH